MRFLWNSMFVWLFLLGLFLSLKLHSLCTAIHPSITIAGTSILNSIDNGGVHNVGASMAREPVSTATFFNLYRIHSAAAQSKCNMFCLDCNVDAFCFYCRSSKHKDHQDIQIRLSSYHDVVRVSEIEKVLDICSVQTYVVNSTRVFFLNERPQHRGGKAVSHVCEICGRSLWENFVSVLLDSRLVMYECTPRNPRFCCNSPNSKLRRNKNDDEAQADHKTQKNEKQQKKPVPKPIRTVLSPSIDQ